MIRLSGALSSGSRQSETLEYDACRVSSIPTDRKVPMDPKLLIENCIFPLPLRLNSSIQSGARMSLFPSTSLDRDLPRNLSPNCTPSSQTMQNSSCIAVPTREEVVIFHCSHCGKNTRYCIRYRQPASLLRNYLYTDCRHCKHTHIAGPRKPRSDGAVAIVHTRQGISCDSCRIYVFVPDYQCWGCGGFASDFGTKGYRTVPSKNRTCLHCGLIVDASSVLK